MTGSDMMIYEAANPDLVLDAFVTEVRSPQIDISQDWHLKNATVDNGTMIVEVSRKLVTGDTQDHAILDDSSFSFPVHRVISAWGHSDTFSYHGLDRARGTIRWFSGGLNEVQRFEENMKPYENNTISIRAKNYPVKPIETEYASVCVSGNDLRNQGVDFVNGVTMVRIKPHVSGTYVHHFLAYASFSENNDNVGCNMTDYL
jgi:hypothetical protein